MEGWYIEKGPESDVVMSSRVRLARNFKEYPFPFKMNREDAEKVVERVKDAILNRSIATSDYEFKDMLKMNPIDKQALVEKHLISPNLVNGRVASAAIISKDEKVSIMINEEDHLRIQCLFPGLQLDKAWELCDKIDSLLEENIDYAFSEKYGYLTCCPTNLGTGIRASAMLHLPALTMTGYIRGMLEACGKLGIAVRGIYGENSEALGNLFQISNQITLGLSEEEIINNVTNIGNQIINQERSLRAELYRQNPYRFEDKVYRSLGILSNARIISSEESFKLISDVRLGVDMGIIKNIDVAKLNEILLYIQSANLQKIFDRTLSPDERDIKRAELIREKLGIN
ncbi:protein arginine kinase [Acetivibrio clariflavus]|uniref:Protein-arginine kinase n=1 Tax=Acetivibrio clariflavus (strain DSM 19732 / NBRC 101661 / EBR45) TaxID=720554 RepID=G8LT57_ACECE|nr:protein arginine kinase [Acetivibrio clariflavus]AEV67261.1 arginine kinase [Acetivibrio clariflavus DSM 19732]